MSRFIRILCEKGRDRVAQFVNLDHVVRFEWGRPSYFWLASGETLVGQADEDLANPGGLVIVPAAPDTELIEFFAPPEMFELPIVRSTPEETRWLLGQYTSAVLGSIQRSTVIAWDVTPELVDSGFWQPTPITAAGRRTSDKHNWVLIAEPVGLVPIGAEDSTSIERFATLEDAVAAFVEHLLKRATP